MMTYTTNSLGLPTIQKTAGVALDFPFDWTEWLAEVDDTIADFEITATGGEVVLDNQMRTGAVCVAWISGGKAGSEAMVKCSIQTTGGRGDSRVIIVQVVAQR